MIEIDGSYLEGGGQIVRTAVALSAVTGRPCHVFNIRKGRAEAGLKAQHLHGIKAAAVLTGAELSGAEIGSTEITFVPKKIKSGALKIDVGTAGSIGLVLQTLLPPAIRAEKAIVLEIIGGTDVAWAPSTTYFQHILCDFLAKMGIKVKIQTVKYGFYPKGGGKVGIDIEPCKKPLPLVLERRGPLERMDVWSIAAERLKAKHVAERQVESFERALGMPVTNRNVIYAPTLSPGSSVHAHAHYSNCKLGAGALGEPGKPAEKVGEEAALLLKKQVDSGACLDRWMADQILPFVALAAEQGQSKFSVAEITNHCLTNSWTIEKFLPVKFGIEGTKGGPGTISVRRA